jgi:ABC-type antimicrobial peptide transport system permease subunit
MMASLLYGVHPFNPLVLSLVPILLMLVVFGSSYLPARRATRVDPMEALRNQ